MSSIVNKVKEVLHSDKDKDTTHTTSGTHSTHNTSHTVGSTEPRVDPTHHSTTTAGTGVGGTQGTGFSGTDNYTYGSGANRGADGPATRTDGPHSSNLANKADPRVDSDRDHSRNLGANPHGTATTNTTGTTGTSGFGASTGHSHVGGTTGGTAGVYDSSANRGIDGPATRTDGPHNSNLANKLDPRVDSDRDHSRNLGANPHGTATTGTTGSSGYGSSTGHAHVGGTTGNTTGLSDIGANRGIDGPATRTDGPHDSNLANKLDPRVDSDRDHSRNLGANPHGTATTGTTGTTGTRGTHVSSEYGTSTGHSHVGGTTTGLGSTGTNRGVDGPATRTDGPHSSKLANKADPRVDSDRDHSRNLGANPHGTATTGTTGTHTTGTHTSGTHTSGTHGTHSGLTTSGSGPGPAPNTAGPHKSDFLNKADPRVDSDLDGSKTIGGNKTTSIPLDQRDPTDATQVPPSVMQKAIGKPVIAHDDHDHGREKRHSVSHQERNIGH